MVHSPAGFFENISIKLTPLQPFLMLWVISVTHHANCSFGLSEWGMYY